MTWILALALSAAVSAPVDHPHTYLASITGLALKPGERIEGFSLSTWGVTFNVVCRIPDGWTIKAGGGSTPEGVLEGEASTGTTWLSGASPKPLQDVVLVTLDGPVQRRDVGRDGGPAYIPATFNGKAMLSGDDTERSVPLSYVNVRLVPARHCPGVAK